MRRVKPRIKVFHSAGITCFFAVTYQDRSGELRRAVFGNHKAALDFANGLAR